MKISFLRSYLESQTKENVVESESVIPTAVTFHSMEIQHSVVSLCIFLEVWRLDKVRTEETELTHWLQVPGTNISHRSRNEE